jgi:hypothetical protein
MEEAIRCVRKEAREESAAELRGTRERLSKYENAARTALGINHPEYLEEQVDALRNALHDKIDKLNTKVSDLRRLASRRWQSPGEAMDEAFGAPMRLEQARRMLEGALAELDKKPHVFKYPWPTSARQVFGKGGAR